MLEIYKKGSVSSVLNILVPAGSTSTLTITGYLSVQAGDYVDVSLESASFTISLTGAFEYLAD
ncbi:uncharacterized protein METZ01_LOCUS484115 [marine metagenome]|uniref:Uncharacterized protein n=1 Tax=marine metagenome TaxID=408172 RepID=A0A383CGI1_9ZZZZ